MKLTTQERQAIANGTRIIERPVRLNRRGRERGTTIKVGDAFRVGDLCLGVASVSKRRIPGERSRWIIRFEEVGDWAIRDMNPAGPSEMSLPKKLRDECGTWFDDDGEPIPEMPIIELVKELPVVLTWPEEPGHRNGDLIVFRWARVHKEAEGTSHKIDFPDVAIRLTCHPRRRRTLRGSHWEATYTWIGLSREEYLAANGGVTGNPGQSIDPEAPIETVVVTPDDVTRNRRLAAERRREAPKPSRPGRWERQQRREAA